MTDPTDRDATILSDFQAGIRARTEQFEAITHGRFLTLRSAIGKLRAHELITSEQHDRFIRQCE